MITIVSDPYLELLQYLVSSSLELREVECLFDIHEQIGDILKIINKLDHVEDIIFRGSGRRDIQSSKRVSIQLSRLLPGSKIKQLALKNMYCDSRDGEGLEIISDSLESLHIFYNKGIEISLLDCKKLKKITTEEDYDIFCLFHKQCWDDNDCLPVKDEIGRLAPVVLEGCPQLEYFNRMNIKEMRNNGLQTRMYLLKGQESIGDNDDRLELSLECWQCHKLKNKSR